MASYSDFAFVYDELMDEVPYEKWLEGIVTEFKKAGINDGLVLDLGCGTGTMTEMLASLGYDMIGVDMSEDMLSEAILKRDESGHDILYLCQDMREFELYGTVRAIVCMCDSINYLLEDKDIIETFRKVNNYLDPDGLFIFDFNTVYKYKEIIGDAVIAENREDCSFIWENYYEDASHINEYRLTLFMREDEDSCMYRKCEEDHLQKGYELSEMKRMIEESGLIYERAFDSDTLGQVNEKSQRVTVIAREHGKNVKESER